MTSQAPLENQNLLTSPEEQVKFLKEKYGNTCIVKPSYLGGNKYYIFKMENGEPVVVSFGKFDELTFQGVKEDSFGHPLLEETRKVVFLEQEIPKTSKTFKSKWLRWLPF